MDSTLYEDHVVGRVAESLQPQKSTNDTRAQLSLDFKAACQRKSASGLSSLAIDSPDFEKFIASQNDILSSSTPATQILFPKLVTEEQEAYARGFIDALEELHKRQGVPVVTDGPLACMESEAPGGTGSVTLGVSTGCESSVIISSISQSTPSIPDVPVNVGYADAGSVQLCTIVGMPSVRATPIMALAGGHVVAPSIPSLSNGGGPPRAVDTKRVVVKTEENQHFSVLGHCALDKNLPADIIALKTMAVKVPPEFKGSNTACVGLGEVRPFSTPASSTCTMSADEPQTVPCLDAGLSPSSPDEIVLERKRARNRVAAQKCRMRKIERIEELSDRARDLRSENERLAHVSSELRQQIADLKREILSHVNSGCRVMVGSNTH